jgi:hypothetical protein
MARGTFWNSGRLEDLGIALALLVAGALLFRISPRQGGELLTATAAVAVTASAIAFICITIAP